jgi:hypothetical protein
LISPQAAAVSGGFIIWTGKLSYDLRVLDIVETGKFIKSKRINPFVVGGKVNLHYFVLVRSKIADLFFRLFFKHGDVSFSVSKCYK